MEVRLMDVAQVIRSKNSGPYELTLDIIFKEYAMFETFCEKKLINPQLIADLYQVELKDVMHVIEFLPAKAIKATLVRPIASGDLGERDVYGAQQHAPLLGLAFEV
jgi:hypothetical protein